MNEVVNVLGLLALHLLVENGPQTLDPPLVLSLCCPPSTRKRINNANKPPKGPSPLPRPGRGRGGGERGGGLTHFLPPSLAQRRGMSASEHP